MMDAAPKVDTFTFEKSFLEYSQVSQISSRDRAYVDEEPGLRPFYKYEPKYAKLKDCLLYTSPSPRDQRGSRMPSSA